MGHSNFTCFRKVRERRPIFTIMLKRVGGGTRTERNDGSTKYKKVKKKKKKKDNRLRLGAPYAWCPRVRPPRAQWSYATGKKFLTNPAINTYF